MKIFDTNKTEIKTIYNGNVIIKIIKEPIHYLHFKFDDVYYKFDHFLYAKGIAKCDPNDEYDLEKGERIALKRAYIKIEEKRLKILNKIKEAIENKYSKCYDYINKSKNSIYNNGKQLEELTK